MSRHSLRFSIVLIFIVLILGVLILASISYLKSRPNTKEMAGGSITGNAISKEVVEILRTSPDTIPVKAAIADDTIPDTNSVLDKE